MAKDSATKVDTRRQARKEDLKEIIRELHRGGDADDLRRRFAEIIRGTTAAEIGAMEQELIEEGLPESEVRRLCDVHVRVFEDALEGQQAVETSPGDPLHALSLENRALRRLIATTRAALASLEAASPSSGTGGPLAELKPLVESLLNVDKHYLKKENQLFPRLEARGVSGPSKVMWTIHDDIRARLKDLRKAVERADLPAVLKTGPAVLQEMSDMVDKEEKILFPMCLEKFDERDWGRVREGEGELGYAWISPEEAGRAVAGGSGGTVAGDVPSAGGRDEIGLDTGALSAEQINLMLVHMPVDVSFVDENDTVLYYSATPERIFPRSPGVIGRKVQNCHPPKSLDTVNHILEAFRSGRKDQAEFWIELGGKFIHIRYFAMRDAQRRYKGCLEVSQDVTGIRALKGQRRLLDWES